MESKSERTKRRILNAASGLFWNQSYQGVNVNTICASAEINKATLYRYYASKEELALAVVEDNFERTKDYVFEGSFADSRDPLQRLEGIYRRVYEMARSVREEEGACPGCPFVNIGVEMAAESPKIREAVNRTFARFGAYYRRIVQDAGRRGQGGKREDEDTAVEALIATMNGVMVASKFENRPEAILEGLATARLIVRGRI